MSKITTRLRLGILSSILISSASFAAYSPTPAPYAGVQLGWGKVHQDGISRSDAGVSNLTTVSFSSNNPNQSGFAGRAFAGYLFSPNWGVELGWSKFRNVSTNATALYSNGVTVGLHGTIKIDAVDLVAKGIYPLQDDFNIYGKLGAAYIMQRGSVTGSSGGTSASANKDVNKIFPTFSVGVGYDITCNVATDFSWNRIQKVGSSNASSTDLVALGLIYKFV